jgi:hypothetical protein
VRRTFLLLLTAALMAVSLVVAPTASAARQSGLVNINLERNVVQVPVALAANICNLEVNLLVGELIDDGEAVCNADAFADATVTPRDGGNGSTRQDGLINVNIQDNTVQIPIAAAANVCDVDVAILVGLILETGATRCEANAGADAVS